MPSGYYTDGGYLRHYSAIDIESGFTIVTFDGPTEMADGTPTYNFAGEPMATAGGAPYASLTVTFTNAPNGPRATHYVYAGADGSTYLDDQLTYDSSGHVVQAYDSGHIFDGQPYAAVRDSFNAAGQLTQQIYYDSGGGVYVTANISRDASYVYENDYDSGNQLIHEYYKTLAGQVFLDEFLQHTSGGGLIVTSSGTLIQQTGFASRVDVYGSPAATYYNAYVTSSAGSPLSQSFYDASGALVLQNTWSNSGNTITSQGSYLASSSYSEVIHNYYSFRTGAYVLHDTSYLNRDGSQTFIPEVGTSYTSRVLTAGVTDADDVFDFRKQDSFSGNFDTVTFHTGFGNDSILGFYTDSASTYTDVLRFDHAIFANLADLRAAAHASAANPYDLVITDAQHDTLTLYGVLNGHTINQILYSGDSYFI